jgi:hypothetical protein
MIPDNPLYCIEIQWIIKYLNFISNNELECIEIQWISKHLNIISDNALYNALKFNDYLTLTEITCVTMH